MGPTLEGMPRKKAPSTEFGRRLLSLRQSRGLTQVQLAEAAGTSQRVVSHYETVAEYPAVDLLPRMQPSSAGFGSSLSSPRRTGALSSASSTPLLSPRALAEVRRLRRASQQAAL
jgi:transcriptional regulator with XRE-family HTH domain